MRLILTLGLTLAAGGAFGQESQPQTAAALVERGQYVATAADCAGCHGADLSGGLAVQSPLGAIYASNITPDAATGIGGWTEGQLRDALRKGRAPGKGWLYPAMPYTSYTGMTDGDVSALYAYLQNVPAVANEVKRTELGFPFVRPAMIGWNLLNLREGKSVGAQPASGEAAERGRYLVETLGHCTACHTPRGALLGDEAGEHLAGALTGGWHAPNITSAPSGIGDWSDAQLAALLQTGHNDVAVVAGDMGLAVSRSLSRLPDTDIADIIAYLRQVPAIDGAEPPPPLANAVTVDPDTVEGPITGWENLAAVGTTDGAILYQSACASCHGLDGGGGAGPELGRLRDLRTAYANNIVQVIAGGINQQIGDRHMVMPAFGQQMTNAQIAAVAGYVRTTFGGNPASAPSDADVASILSPQGQVSWVLRHAAALVWIAIAAAVALALMLIWMVLGRRRRRV